MREFSSSPVEISATTNSRGELSRTQSDDDRDGDVDDTVHVFSLDDFATVACRFDTAGDFVTFLEMRQEISAWEEFRVQDEDGNIQRMIPHVEKVLLTQMSPASPEVMKKTVAAREEIATGKLLGSPEWKYSLAIDDMIAHSHDVDSDLPYSTANSAARDIATYFGWLTRDRRTA